MPKTGRKGRGFYPRRSADSFRKAIRLAKFGPSPDAGSDSDKGSTGASGSKPGAGGLRPDGQRAPRGRVAGSGPAGDSRRVPPRDGVSNDREQGMRQRPDSNSAGRRPSPGPADGDRRGDSGGRGYADHEPRPTPAQRQPQRRPSGPMGNGGQYGAGRPATRPTPLGYGPGVKQDRRPPMRPTGDVRPQEPLPGSGGRDGRVVPGRDSARHGGHTPQFDTHRERRGPSGGNVARGPKKPSASLLPGEIRDGGERVSDKRRSGSGSTGGSIYGGTARAKPGSKNKRLLARGSGSGVAFRGTGSGNPRSRSVTQPKSGGGQRGFRGPGPGERSGPEVRPGEGEHPRESGGAGPSSGDQRNQDFANPAPRPDPKGKPARSGDDMPRRGRGSSPKR